jgi:hypothetical protein
MQAHFIDNRDDKTQDMALLQHMQALRANQTHE